MTGWLLAAALVGCVPEDEAAPVAGPGEWTVAERATLATLRLDPKPRPDPSDAVADDEDAARLGQALFFDAGLSPAGVGCATCHVPSKGFADGLPIGHGVGTPGRHTPGLVGLQDDTFFFWDGRADSLWSQALGPMENPAEMGSDRLYVAKRVLATHADDYEAVFHDRPDLSKLPDHARPTDDPADPAGVAWAAMSPEDRQTVNRVATNVGKAIEAYERELVPRDAPFDRYVDAVLAGDAKGGGNLSDAQIRGLTFFLRDGGCTNCHSGPMFTDRAFHNLGVPEPKGYDGGRAAGAQMVLGAEFNCLSAYSDTKDCPQLKYLNPGFVDFQAAFKTPSLRYVAETGPYMHNGTFPDLDAVLAFYSTLPGDPPAGHRELTLKPLNMTGEQMADLQAFLGSLTGEPLPAELTGPPGMLAADGEK